VLDDARPALEPVRSEFHAEAAARVIPLHITILFPFVSRVDIPERALEELCSPFSPLDFSLTRLSEFPDVVYAVPEPDDELLALVRADSRTRLRRGEFEDVVPHATLSEGVPRETVERRCAALLPLACYVDQVALLVETAPDRWSDARRFPLSGAANLRP
jgi:2'-5' RNA ligase